MKFISSSLAPLVPVDYAYRKRAEVHQITDNSFDQKNVMVGYNPDHGKYMSTLLTYRGDVLHKDVC